MGLLHPLTQLGAKSSLWELVDLGQQVAGELGIPVPPEVTKMLDKLPSIADAVGSGDPQQLLGLVGPDIAQALGAQLDDPVLQSLVRGDLEGAKDSLLSYAGNLVNMKLDLGSQLHEALGDLGALRDMRGKLNGLLDIARDLPGALTDLTGMPILGEALELLAQHSPELAQVIRMASEQASRLDSQIRSVENLVGDVTRKIESVTDLRSLAELAVGELDQHIDGLGDVFGAAKSILGAIK
ncbi:hypothetical protein [Deinococcus wulumuqiensis]|uniref:DUF1641 domain-containing protein n=1 Tax=Deinococcus wulumuqiensis TaxID=980427 RepID=A0AAV4K5K7_9DEIO|nr:hypothetical protein [Deinococcus wulumuqiensis]QII20058.1 hypothetical protein G6R31_04230 [Deinococcus wulumuqiensis R12]GGI87284.1 hypothetical protein GCM10010914_22210 [Deinococcus wulumuqiensis]GGP29994.1 hypothetical protein GCM10008021_16450 [Deinococcus wulumuqiensis]